MLLYPVAMPTCSRAERLKQIGELLLSNSSCKTNKVCNKGTSCNANENIRLIKLGHHAIIDVVELGRKMGKEVVIAYTF